jgi:hypothetical protein
MSGACEYRKNRYVGRQGADSKKPRLAETKRGVARDDYFYLVEIRDCARPAVPDRRRSEADLQGLFQEDLKKLDVRKLILLD